MADRIIHMRALLRKHLEDLGSPLPWNHITDQIGEAHACMLANTSSAATTAQQQQV